MEEDKILEVLKSCQVILERHTEIINNYEVKFKSIDDDMISLSKQLGSFMKMSLQSEKSNVSITENLILKIAELADTNNDIYEHINTIYKSLKE